MLKYGTTTLKKALTIAAFFTLLATLFAVQAQAGAIEDTFSKSDKNSTKQVNHSVWDELLKTYIKQGSDGLNRVDYGKFKANDHQKLKTYIKSFKAVSVSSLNRNEQFAFWANLYNAVTIDVILEHYPTKSIRDIDISPGIFADGPWGKKLISINGVELSLDDIEHKILRGLWKDPRVHYAVNCASIGCPNLSINAFTGAKLEEMLNEGAKAFVNNPRGVEVKNGRVTVSKIYSWFKKDFGTSEKNILKHIRKYANPELTKKLNGKSDIYSYQYDWSLNDVK